MDFFLGGDLGSCQYVNALLPPEVTDDGSLAGGVMVGDADELQAPFTGSPDDLSGAHVEVAAGGEDGVEVKVGTDVHGRGCRSW